MGVTKKPREGVMGRKMALDANVNSPRPSYVPLVVADSLTLKFYRIG